MTVALAPNVLAKSPQKTLRILQWSHFVPSYDKWFDKYAADWGSSHGVDVTVDHVEMSSAIRKLIEQDCVGADWVAVWST